MHGAIIYSNMTDLHVDVMNFTLNGSATGGMNMEGEGHYHIYINDVLVGPYNETMVHLKDLPAGDHVLKVVLVNNDHSHIHPMTMDMIEFTLMDERPMISIVKPGAGDYFYGSTLEVQVAIEDLMMNASAIGGNNSAGEGHWHLYINGDLIGPYTDSMVTLTDLPVGHHTLKVMLANNDHTPVMPEASAMVDFHLLGIPSIEIVSPVNGTTLEGNTLAFEVEVMNFILNSSAIGGSNMPGEGHYHVYINDVLVGPYTDTMVSIPDLPAGDHILKVELYNNDHSALDIVAMDMIYFTILESEPMDTNITIMFGPVLHEDDPVEGARVELSYGGSMFTGTTGSDGKVSFTVPMEWEGMEVNYKVMMDDYEDLEGTGTVSDDGMVSVSGDIELEKEDEDDDNMMIWLIIIILVILLIVGAIVILRPKGETSDMEE
jgi:hypothetical protein